MDDQDSRLLAYLGSYITDNKKGLIDKVLNDRTRHFTVVLEDIYQPQNASAVIRTADCFGIQDVHIIQNKHKFKINPRVVHGSSKWVDVHQYEPPNALDECLATLKQQGYKLVATTPDRTARPIQESDITDRQALIFGTEQTGISDRMKGLVDECITIPMYGFTESFNISVSAALVLSNLVQRLHSSSESWQLSADEKNQLKLNWYRKIVNRSDLLEKEFLKSN